MTLPRKHVPYKVYYSVKEANSSQISNNSQVLSLPDPPTTEDIIYELRANYAIPKSAEITISKVDKIMKI